MTKLLSPEAVAQFECDGFHFPVDALSPAEALHYRRCLERYEADSGGVISSNMRHKVHLLFTWADALVRHPRILDAVEDIIGPNIICWGTNFFIKEAHDPGYVSWHQDSTYWGLEPADVITAWVALSDAALATGPMKFWPGSHKFDQLPHSDTFHEHNLLSRGQEIDVSVNEEDGVLAPLKAGQVSLHHIRLVHGSAPNTTDDRRIGLAIRYVPPHVRQIRTRDTAMLVRGEDRYGHFDPEPAPLSDLDAAALAAHADAMQRMVGNLYDGTGKTAMKP